MTAAAFGQRRKMLRSSLKGIGAPAESLIRAAGLGGDSRAEQVDVEGFVRLARALQGAGAA